MSIICKNCNKAANIYDCSQCQLCNKNFCLEDSCVNMIVAIPPDFSKLRYHEVYCCKTCVSNKMKIINSPIKIWG
jgi:hypothetical protein